MADISDYTFNNMGRIGNDSCTLSESDIQNVKSGNYLLENHFANECDMKKPIQFALNQPNVFYKGSHGVGIGGCNIDQNSELSIGAEQTTPVNKLVLQERQYLTIPYLGRGKTNVDMESQLLQGDTFTNRKSVNPSSEVSYMTYSNYPLIPSVEESVANPSNLIEESADENWIRGGLPSRDMVRDNKN
jgi:hypothetical protein